MKNLWSIIKRIMGINPTKVAFTSGLPVDQTMLSFSFTIDVTGTSTATNLGPFGNITTNSLWLARFSLDGQTWASADGVITSGSGYCAMVGSFRASYLVFTFENTTGTAQQVRVECSLIARDDQLPFEGPAPGSILAVNSGGATNAVINNNPTYPLFDSRENYMKIAVKGILPFSIPSDSGGTLGLLTIPHNLGYIPYSFLQYEYIDTESHMINLSNATETVSVNLVPVFSYIYADTSNIYVRAGNNNLAWNVNVHYRVYYDTTL